MPTPESPLVLVRFPWTVAAGVAAGIASVTPAQRAPLYRSLAGSEGYAWVEGLAEADAGALRERIPGIALARLEPLESVDGASAGHDAPYRYVVETDVAVEHEVDFNAWYHDEHLAGLASVTGTVRAARYRDRTGQPRYLACYDLEHPDVLGSAPWLAVRATPWSDRVRPHFTNTKRTMFRRA
jgi:hypothetical protein